MARICQQLLMGTLTIVPTPKHASKIVEVATLHRQTLLSVDVPLAVKQTASLNNWKNKAQLILFLTMILSWNMSRVTSDDDANYSICHVAMTNAQTKAAD